MKSLSAVKAGIAVFTFLWTAFSSITTSYIILRRPDDVEKTGASKVKSFLRYLTCVASGVLSGLCFIGLVPSVNKHFQSYLQSDLKYMAPNLSFVGSFILVWGLDAVMHEIVKLYEKRRSTGESEKLSILNKAKTYETNETSPGETEETDNEKEDNIQPVSELYVSILLAIALGIHAFLEGMGIGLMGTLHQAVLMAIVTGLHEGLAAISCVVNLLNAKGTTMWTVTTILLFYSAVLPLGAGVGIAIVDSSVNELALGVCKAMAAGAIFFVVFLEMLPKLSHDKHKDHPHIPTLLILLYFVAGFAVVAGLEILDTVVFISE